MQSPTTTSKRPPLTFRERLRLVRPSILPRPLFEQQSRAGAIALLCLSIGLLFVIASSQSADPVSKESAALTERIAQLITPIRKRSFCREASSASGARAIGVSALDQLQVAHAQSRSHKLPLQLVTWFEAATFAGRVRAIRDDSKLLEQYGTATQRIVPTGLTGLPSLPTRWDFRPCFGLLVLKLLEPEQTSCFARSSIQSSTR